MADSVRMCFVSYDIPENSGLPNPSGRLRRLGVRINLSVWVLPEAAIPNTLVARQRARGANWYIVRFADDEAEALLNLATDALRKEAQAAAVRVGQSIERTEYRLTNAEAGDRAISHEGYVRRVRQAVRRSEKLLDDLRAAAGVMGVSFALEDAIAGASASVEALRSASMVRAELYVEAARQASLTGPEGQALAQAAERDEIPAAVLADHLEERGVDVSALREAFRTPEPAAAPALEPVPEEWVESQDEWFRPTYTSRDGLFTITTDRSGYTIRTRLEPFARRALNLLDAQRLAADWRNDLGVAAN